MAAGIHLILHNVVSVTSAVALLGIGLFTYLNAPRKTSNIAFALTMLAACVFTISHVVGVNLADPALSQEVLILNLATIFISVFNVHATLAILGKEKEKRGMILLIYAAGTALVAFFALFPDLFLLPSVPKLYFPNYYEPGSLHWVRLVFEFAVCTPYILYESFRAYRRSESAADRNRYKYYVYAVIFGYGLGFIPNFLVYGIPIDPLIGMTFSMVFTIPIMYGSVRYGLLNVKIIAQQAFFYSLAVGAVGGLIALFNYSNVWIQTFFPAYPAWVSTLISSVIVVSMSVFVWQRLRESDILKYEFITTVTHKFRTPLTHIKWASENLVDSGLDAKNREQVNFIQEANGKLVELTNLLVSVSETENSAYSYVMEKRDISLLAAEVVESETARAAKRNIRVETALLPGMLASIDRVRMTFVLKTLIENAANYMPAGGVLSVSTERRGRSVVVRVRDTGIGIPKDEMPFLFSKFYRGKNARAIDTEGMGIGLYIAEQIVSRHRGSISAQSEGVNKGSTFEVTLPAALPA